MEEKQAAITDISLTKKDLKFFILRQNGISSTVHKLACHIKVTLGKVRHFFDWLTTI